MIRVALVDDQAMVRAGLGPDPLPADGFEVVAECADGREAVEHLPALRPDVILMDIRMPRLDGIAATAQLRAGADPARSSSLTTFGEDEVLWGALEAGAAGFVLKDSSAEDLIAAVRAVAGGGAWFDPGVAPRVLDRYRRGRRAGDPRRGPARPPDRARARRAAADGARRDQRRDRRTPVVAEATVKTHVGSIFTKLDVRDRAAAIVFAYDHGVVSPGAAPTPSRTHASPPGRTRTGSRGPMRRPPPRDLASPAMTEHLARGAVVGRGGCWPCWVVALVAAIAITRRSWGTC